VPVDFAIFGKFVQTLVPGTGGAAAAPLKTEVLQCLDTWKSYLRCFRFSVQAVLTPLGCAPRTQLGVIAVVFRNVSVPVDFAIVGKFTQTVLSGTGGAAAAPFQIEALQCLDTRKSYL
jgi:hypothetical protein